MSRLPAELSTEQQAVLDAIERTVAKIRQCEAEYTQLLVAGKRLNIPIKRIAAAAGVERKTIYNQLSRVDES